MTNEEYDLLIAYLVDAGDIDPDGYVEAQFLEWYQVRDQVVSGEAHYKAVLDAARIRKRSYQRGNRTGGSVRWQKGEPAPGDPSDLLALCQEQQVCDHDTPCGCYAEGYAVGMAEAESQHHHDNQENLEALRRVIDSFHRVGN